MRLLSREEMRQVDNIAINDYGIPGSVLMENAGRALADEAVNMLGEVAGKKIIIIAGGGNNGGDGLVAARHLYNKGALIRIFMLIPGDSLRGDALLNWQIVKKMAIESQDISDERHLKIMKVAFFQADLLIDAIFGTGLSENIRGIALPLINLVNEAGLPVLSCDIPSGICADSGRPLGVAVKATRTVTFGLGKIGLYQAEAAPYVGILKVADISLPREAIESMSGRKELIDDEFCRHWLKPRAKNTHKGDYGHVLVLAGSPSMPGAAILSAKSVLRMGAGLLTVALPALVRTSFSANLPEAMHLILPQNSEGVISKDAAEAIVNFSADAILIGPGLGRRDETAQLVRNVVAMAKVPLVLDADALYAFSGRTEELKKAKMPPVLTPHPGEMARLSGLSIDEIQKNRVKIASLFAKEWQSIVVLKGAGTVVADPSGRIFINSTGNPGMATAGSGDVLAGALVSLIAQGLPNAISAALAVFLHGKAGDIAAEELSNAGIMAMDIVNYLPKAQKLFQE